MGAFFVYMVKKFNMNERGFYIISNQFFVDMNDSCLKGNKDENRPHYYCMPDAKNGVYWFIPLSSRVDKYKKIIEKRKLYNKPCDTLHIARLDNGKESAFLIQDMFPITQNYVEREYTIAGEQLFLTSETVAAEIERKAKRVRSLLLRGVKFTPTQPDVLLILDKLTNNKIDL